MPVKTRLPPELFGDALMVLEFLKAFGELFDLTDEFPESITLGVRGILMHIQAACSNHDQIGLHCLIYKLII